MVRRISSGCSGRSNGWWSISAASYGPGTPASSRGEQFQVLGTTHWYREIFPSSICTQWPSAPRAASRYP